MRLTKAILIRLLFGLLSLLFISFVIFVAQAFSKGDAATMIAGEKATPQQVQQLRHQMGLDRPWPVRYVEFVANAAHGEFGSSYYGTHEPVRDTLARTLPLTLNISILAILLSAAVGIGLGTLAAVFRNGFPDRSVLTLSTLGVTVPNFVLAPTLVYLVALKIHQVPVDWNPTDLASFGMFRSLLLPVLILAARPMALLTRLTRASMIDTLQQEFIRTAVAKGVPPLRLIFGHALRNAILPVITAIGTTFGILLTGSFIIETAFSIPGVGKTTIEAIQRGDTPVIQACVFVTGAMFIVLNTVVDLILPLLDPRIRESQI